MPYQNMPTVTRLSHMAAGVLMASVAAHSANAEYQLAPGLSVTGFIDMSVLSVDPDNAKRHTDAGLDQFELDFTYDFGSGFKAYVDVEYDDDGNGKETDIEQAYITYALSDALTAKAGRFLSSGGWETEEPTGRYQYSNSGYAKYFYGGYQQGVSLYYGRDAYGFGASLITDIGNLKGDVSDADDPAVELMAAVHPNDLWTAKAFYITQEADNGYDTEIFTGWTSYTAGPLTLALELNRSENTNAAVALAGAKAEGEGFLAMANYEVGEWGFTLRYHAWEIETASGHTAEDVTGVTFSPSYRVNDNLMVIAEYRVDEEDVTGVDTDAIALELLVTF